MQKNIITFLLILIIIFGTKLNYAFGKSIIRDAEIESYLKTILNSILEQSEINEKIKFRVVLDKNFNAFVIPNSNTIFINTGLISDLENVDEFSAIVAHELSHLILNHPSFLKANFNNRSMLETLTTLGTIALGTTLSPDLGLGLGIAAINSSNVKLFAYSRELETIADELSIKILKKANISFDGIINKLRSLKQEQIISSNSILFQTHPYIEDRIIMFENARKTSNNSTLILNNKNNKLLKQIKLKIEVYTREINFLERKYNNLKETRESLKAKSVILYRKGDFKNSLKSLHKIKKYSEFNCWDYEFEGDILYRTQDYLGAINAFKKSLNTCKSGLVYFSLGKSYLAVGNTINHEKNNYYSNASKYLLKALTFEKNLIEIKEFFGKSLAKQGKLAEAYMQNAEIAFLKGNITQAKLYAKKIQNFDNVKSSIKIKAQDILNY